MIELRDVTIRYDRDPVVDSITTVIDRAQTTVLLGRSGSGKTTLLRAIIDMVTPASGTIEVDGKATTEWDRIRLRRQTGYVIQEAGLLPHYTVARNIGLVPELEGWEAERIRARIAELLELVNLDPELASRRPHQLSGGQRQRVGVARALAADPELLLCDEPFGALDPITRAEMQREFRSLALELGKTIVFVTHDVREAMVLADRVLLLHRGRLAVDGSWEAFCQSDHPEARAFVASLEVTRRERPS